MRFIFLFTLFCFLFSCADWEYPQDFPIILTEEITDVSADGAVLSGNIVSLGSNQNITRYGFVWSEPEYPKLHSSTEFAFSGNIHEGKFSKLITTDLKKGKVYYVRAYIETDKQVIYGNQVKFESKGSMPPTITSFAPASGFVGTEIVIRGHNFSTNASEYSISIGSIACQVISVSDSLLKIISPINNIVGSHDKIAIKVLGHKVYSNTEHTVIGPNITSISRQTGRVGDLILIEGEYFDMADELSVTWTVNFPVQKNIYGQLEGYLPDVQGTGKFELHSIMSTGQTRYLFPENFTMLDSWSKISNNLPLQNNSGYSSAIIGNSIFIVGGKKLHEFNTTTNTWTERADFPGFYRFFGSAFSLNGILYYGFGEGYQDPYFGFRINGEYYNDLWSYDPTTNLWSLIGTAPLAARSNVLSMVINNKVYFGFGRIQTPSEQNFFDFWEYTPATNTWMEIQSASITNYTGKASSFTANGKGYIVGLETTGRQGEKADFWEFDSSVRIWTKKQDFPDAINGEAATVKEGSGLVVTSANSSVSRVYEYNHVKDRWIKRQSLFQSNYEVFKFSQYINGKLYYGSNQFWELSF